MHGASIQPSSSRRPPDVTFGRAAAFDVVLATRFGSRAGAIAQPIVAAEPTISAGSTAPAGPEPFREFLGRRRFASLDGLRALGVLSVVWHHTVSRGWGGVSLFFALSGFLITTGLIRAHLRGEFSIAAFYERTARRILPLYFAVLAVYLAMVLFLERDVAARQQFLTNLPAFATFTANWFVDLNQPRVIFYFVWSLSAQVQFYLVWPWIERKRRPWLAILLAVAFLLLSQTLAAVDGATAREVLGLRMLSGVPAGILIGIVLAHALHTRRAFAALRPVCGRRGSGWAALGVVAWLAWFPNAAGAGHEALAALAHASLIATCVMREDHDLARLLRWRALAAVGVVGYGVYLMHMLAVNAVRRCEQRWDFHSGYLEFAGGLLLAVALAIVSRRLFEQRFLAERAA
jgi:peptidoglycan/LPS O-acetylase OafA/YrhL